jgi:hypothetical protein
MEIYIYDSNTPITCTSDNDTEKFMESKFMTLKCENFKEGRSVRADTLGCLLVRTVQH